jgi:tyrosine-protein phosphatase YwqE
MFIFKRKKFIGDSIKGMLDIHNHVLPGIDDGAQTVKDSLAILNGFVELGIDKMICTPHIKMDQFPNTPDSINRSYKILMDEMVKNSIQDLHLNIAAEHMLDQHFEQLLLNDQFLTLPGGYLLVETSFRGLPLSFAESLSKIQDKGFYPVLAHPERYFYFQGNLSKLRGVKNQGVFLQVNLLSLVGYYGKDIKKQALKLISNGLIDFIGTDVHNTYQLELIKNSTASKELGKSIKKLSENNYQHFII